jgi:hypothetical protein
MNKRKISLHLLAVVLLIAPWARASTDSFNFVFTDGNVSGSGTLYGTLEDSGSWFLTSGTGTFNDGIKSGSISLIVNSSGPGYSVVSPSGYFAYDNQLFPFFGPSQLIDEDGLLFSFNGIELNLWQGGNSPGRGGWAENNGNGDLNGSFTITSYNLQQPPSIAIRATAVSVARGATTANTSLITVTPAGSFAGNVLLTAAITSSPAGAQYPPTLSFGSTNLVTLSSAAAGNATLTITTAAATSSAQTSPVRPVPWYSAGSMALACVLLFGFPARRRKCRTVLGVLVLLAALNGGWLACGGGAVSKGGSEGTSSTGTTAGVYTILVTGASGQLTATSTISLNVL